MSDFGTFVAAALRDKVMSELLSEVHGLRDHVKESACLRITGKDGHPVYVEAQLQDGALNHADPNFWYLSLQHQHPHPHPQQQPHHHDHQSDTDHKQHQPQQLQLPCACPLIDLDEAEISIGGIRIGGFANGDNVTGVHLDPYNAMYKVFNLYCDRVAAVTVGIKGFTTTQWDEFLGDVNPRRFVRGLTDILAQPRPQDKSVIFQGISIPVQHICRSPCMTDILLKNQRSMDDIRQSGMVHITGRYGHPIYAQTHLNAGSYHSGDSNVWYLRFDETQQRMLCHLSNLSSTEIYVGGIRFGRFDGDVYADNLDPHNTNCKVWDLHPVGLCVATIGIYGWNDKDWTAFRHNHDDASLVDLQTILSNPQGKTVAFQGISLPVKHIKTFPLMHEILQQHEVLCRQMRKSGTVRITGRHGQPVYAQAQLTDGILEHSGYTERLHVDLDSSKQLSQCDLASLSGVEVQVAGVVVATFASDEVFAHLLETTHIHPTGDGDGGKVWELSCDGLAGATIGIHGWSNDHWTRLLGSSDPREIGILDLPSILEQPSGKIVSFLSIKFRVDGRLRRLLKELQYYHHHQQHERTQVVPQEAFHNKKLLQQPLSTTSEDTCNSATQHVVWCM